MVAEQRRSRARIATRSTRTTTIQCEISDSWRLISTEVRNAKTLTILVRVRCLARRREPTQPIDVEKRVGESDDKSVIKNGAQV